MQRRRNGIARKMLQALMVEHMVLEATVQTAVQAPTTHCDVMYADLAEAFAGVGHPTRLAPAHNLTACPPAEIQSGWDLASEEGQDRWRRMVREERPMLIIIGFPCTLWNKFACNINWSTPERREILEGRRLLQKPLKQLMAWTMKEQYDNDRLFLFENPPGSEVWEEEEFTDVWQLDGVVSAINHSP